MDSIIQHEMISYLKELYELCGGRVPTKFEFFASKKFGERALIKEFRTYSGLCAAAGLQLNKPHHARVNFPQQHTAEHVESEIEKHAAELTPIGVHTYQRIVVLGDFHSPFHDKNAVEKAIKLIKELKPDVVVQIGDLYDLYAASKFPRSLNLYTPKAEFELARQGAEELWKSVKEACNPQCYQLLGNHDARVMKRVLERWPEGEHLIAPVMKQIFSFEGVTTIHDSTEELIIGDIAFVHGYLGQIGAHRDYNNMNVVCGHSHRGGVSYRAFGDKTLWELNVGYLGDPYSKALSYRPQKLHNWTQGVGVIDNLGPRFVHF